MLLVEEEKQEGGQIFHRQRPGLAWESRAELHKGRENFFFSCSNIRVRVTGLLKLVGRAMLALGGESTRHLVPRPTPRYASVLAAFLGFQYDGASNNKIYLGLTLGLDRTGLWRGCKII